MAAGTYTITEANAPQIDAYIATKQIPRVVSQTPAAGTPVIEGMTILVKTVSLSDVPYHVLDADAPAAMRDVPLADIEKVIVADETVKAAVTSGTVPEADRTLITDKFNSTFGVTLTANEAESLVKNFQKFGFGGFGG